MPWMVIVWTTLLGLPSIAAEPDAMITRMYPIADLLDLPLDGEDDKETVFVPVPAGGGMGGMGGGGGDMGGGGMFCVPDNVLGQLAGGGMGGGSSSQSLASHYVFPQTIADLLIWHTQSDAVSWELTGGPGRISVLGTSLLVTQNAAGHDAVTALLDMLRKTQGKRMPIQVELRLIEIASEAAASVNEADAEALGQLAQSEKAMMLSLRCDNHDIGKVSAGLRRSYVVSAIPVVGSNGLDTGGGRSVGYRPEIETKLLGIFGQVRPMIGSEKSSGRIQISIGLSSGPEEVLAAEFSDEVSIDRVEIETTHLEATVSAEPNQWTVAGVTTVADATSTLTSGQALPHIVTLVRWSAAH